MRKHKLTAIQRRILRQIPEGIERPVKIADIARITRIKERTVNIVFRDVAGRLQETGLQLVEICNGGTDSFELRTEITGLIYC